MKFKYDKEVDIVYIKLSDKPVVESDEDKPGIIIDYDADGNIAGMEILDASNRMQDPYKLEYEPTG
jgi:uncharacterized protein YuzE